MRRIALISFMLLALCPPVWAQDPIHKMGRGVVNLITGWVEVPKQMHRGRTDENPFKGFGGGLVRGAGLGLLRMGYGLYEMVSFPFPYPKDFASPYTEMELPDYAWQ